MRKIWFCSSSVIVQAAMMASAHPALAQTAPISAPVSASEPVARSGLEVIVVTARRRAESVQDVPATVSVIGAAEIKSRDLTSIEKIAAATPQLAIGRSPTGSGAQIVLRGIGSSASSSGIEQSVAVVVDGVYFGQGRAINDGMLDVNRVEILKGPQALFFGKNATAGVISVTSADPGPSTEGSLKAGYEFGSKTIYGEGMYSAPLTDTLGIRFAVRASKMYGGYFENLATAQPFITRDSATGIVSTNIAPPASREAPGERNLTGRITLKWTPTDQLTVTLKGVGTRYRSNSLTWNQVIFNCPSSGGRHPNTGSPCLRDFKTYQNDLPPIYAASGFPDSGKDGSLYENYNSYSFTGTLAYQLENAAITSITNYQHLDGTRLGDYDAASSATGGNNAPGSNTSGYNAFSNETRILTSYDGPINFLAGVLYQNTKFRIASAVIASAVENSAAPAGLRYVTFTKTSHTKGETVSPYTQVIWKVIPQVELTGGVRYIHETKVSDLVQPYANPFLAGFYIANRPFGADQTFDKWLPEVTVKWQANNDINIFAAYKTGYKSGGFSGSASITPNAVASNFTFGPESATGFEAGIKSTLFDRSVRLNISAYRFKYSGLQTDFFNSVDRSFLTVNAGSAEAKGVEAEIEWAPGALAGFTLRASGNYNKARYSDFQGPCYSGQSRAAGCTLTGPVGALFQDLSGKPLLNAPLWTAGLGLNYEMPLSDALVLGLSGNARYSGEYFASAFGNPAALQPSYVNLDAGIRLAANNSRWELAVIGKNLTNNFVVNGVIDAPFTGSGTGTAAGVPAAQVGFAGLPRTVQVEGTFRF